MKAPVPWWESFDFLAPDCRQDFGRLVDLLEEGILSSSITQLGDEPAGWAGIIRRGPWDRLVSSEWALAEAHPEEFLRRADEGELSFWEIAKESDSSTRTAWVWVDAGPDQLGACRVVQIALLLWLQRVCRRSGGAFYWGTIQDPEKGYECLGAQELKVFLSARSCDPPRRPPERMKTEETWCIGAWEWTVRLPAEFQRVALSQIDSHTVELRAFGRRLILPLPAGPRAVRLLRDPLTWQLSSRPERSKDFVGERFKFSQNGKRLIFVTDQRVTLLPLPQSVNDLPGKPRPYTLPWKAPVVAATLEGKTISVVQVDGNEWVFSRLNPPTREEKDWARVQAPEVELSEVGECWKDEGLWHLCVGDSFYRVKGEKLELFASIRGYLPSGASTLVASSKGEVLNSRGEVLGTLSRRHPTRAFLVHSYEFSGLVVAHHVLNDWWRIHWGEIGDDIMVRGAVAGLHCVPKKGPKLVVNKNGMLVLQDSDGEEPLDIGEPVAEAQVNPNGLLVFRTETGEFGCFDLHARALFRLTRP